MVRPALRLRRILVGLLLALAATGAVAGDAPDPHPDPAQIRALIVQLDQLIDVHDRQLADLADRIAAETDLQRSEFLRTVVVRMTETREQLATQRDTLTRLAAETEASAAASAEPTE